MRPQRRIAPRAAAPFDRASVLPALAALALLAAAAGLAAAADAGAPAAPSAPVWREDEYARMRRSESDAERQTRLESQAAQEAFNPGEYNATTLFRQGLQTAPPPTPEAAPGVSAELGRIRVVSDDYLDYDEKKNLIYGRARTTVYYKGYVLKADKILIDVRLREAEAAGNVEMTIGDDKVTADKIAFNFERQEGVAYNVKGEMTSVYFRGSKDETADTPSFRKVDPQTSIFRDSSLTGCDFPVPHYRVRAREFILVERDRVFARSAMLYIWEVPVGFVPAYTRSLAEHSPWSFVVGYDSELGALMRVSYDYYYKDYWPNPETKSGFERRAFMKTTLIYDYLAKRGHGMGVESDYDFDFDRHRGQLKLYQIKDRDREIETIDGVDESDENRYRALWRHRSTVARDLYLHSNLDWVSDPEIYDDILDYFNNSETRRVPERRFNLSLALVKDAWLARIVYEIKDRIGRDRVNNYAAYGDDDADFDKDLDSRGRTIVAEDGTIISGTGDDDDIDGLPTTRWARVTERKPQVTLATRWLKPTRAPVYYMLDLNFINNLDKGLNTLSEDDDAFVRGFDLYQSLMHTLRVGDRSTLVTKAGVGFGSLDREDDRYGYDFIDAVETPDGFALDSLVFSDPGSETFLVGTDEYSLSDYSKSFYYADFDTKWTTRFTDALTGYIRYFIREGTKDALGEWYRRIGNRMARADLYDYRVRKHEITAGLGYALLNPNLTVNLDGGVNLRSKSDRVPGETIHWATLSTAYASRRDVFKINGGVGYYKIQRYHPSDINESEGRVITGHGDIEVFPIPERVWLKLGGWVYKNLDKDPAVEDQRRREEEAGIENRDNRYDENRTDYDITTLIGAKLDAKWKIEARANYSGLREEFDRYEVILTRDLHDAILGLGVSTRRTYRDDDETGDEISEQRISYRASLTLKKLSQDTPLSQGRLTTLQDSRRRSEYD